MDRLEKAGLVERHPDPADRRRALVTLAPSARERISAAWEQPGQAFTEVLDRYGDAELTVIADYLHRAAEVGRAQADRLTEQSR